MSFTTNKVFIVLNNSKIMDNKKISYILLRTGLGLVFLLIAIDEIRKPLIWAAFIPLFLKNLLPFGVQYFIYFNALFEILISLSLFSGFLIKYTSILGALHMLVIVISLGFNDLAFRDFGLFMAFLAVFFLFLDIK